MRGVTLPHELHDNARPRPADPCAATCSGGRQRRRDTNACAFTLTNDSNVPQVTMNAAAPVDVPSSTATLLPTGRQPGLVHGRTSEGYVAFLLVHTV